MGRFMKIGSLGILLDADLSAKELMLLNCGSGENSLESLGQQGG